MADVKREFTVVAVNTATGNQDITISGFGTPKAAQFFLSEAVTDDTIASHGAISAGFSDGTYSACVAVANEDGQTSTDTQRTAGFGGSYIAFVSDPSGGTKCSLDFVSWITDGVRISVDNNTVPSGYLLTVVLWGGADLDSVKCVERGLQSSTAAQTYTGIGFAFDVLFLAHNYSSVSGGLVHSPFAYGCVINDNATTPTQKSIGFCGDNAASSGDQNTIASDTYALVAPLIGANRWNLTISDISSTGYTHTNSASTGTTTIQLALKFAAGVDFSLTDVSIPTTGNLVESGLSFQPEFTEMALIQGPSAYDTLDTAAPSASLAFALTDSSQVHTISTSDEDGSADTVCKSLSSDQFRMLDYQGSADAFLASGYSLDSNGWTYTLTTNPAAAILGWAFAFSSGGGATPITFAGNATASGTATGSLSTAITMAAGTTATSTAIGDLSTQITFSSDATADVTATGDLQTQITFASDSTANGLASGDLETAITFASEATATATASGDLLTAIKMASDATGTSTASGDLDTSITMAADATATSTATGTIQADSDTLAANATASAAATGSLSTQITMAAGASATTITAGDLETAIVLTGAASASGTTTGDLLTQITLAASVTATATATGIMAGAETGRACKVLLAEAGVYSQQAESGVYSRLAEPGTYRQGVEPC